MGKHLLMTFEYFGFIIVLATVSKVCPIFYVIFKEDFRYIVKPSFQYSGFSRFK